MRISDWSSDVCSSDLPWDSQHIIYFSGYAIWTYLTTPFLFARPGFEVQEIDPWDGEGEVWRRLRVKFPPDVPSHSAEQTFYLGPAEIGRASRRERVCLYV